MLVSNLAEIVAAQDESELGMPLRGYIAAKRSSRESWQRFRQREEFEWIKVTSGIRFGGSIHGGPERVLDEGEHFTVLTEWGSRKFFEPRNCSKPIYVFND